MKIMTGIDLHSNNALCGLMDEKGRRVLHKKLPCDLAAILQVLQPYKARIAQVAVESTYNWYWLVDGLEDHGYPVVLANPARMKQYDGLKHTDDVSDAFFLCELMRLGILPTSHLYNRQTRPVRDLLRRRMLLVQLRTSLILSFKSLNERTLGQRVPLGLVKAMSIEAAQARFTAPADQLLSGEQIGLMGQFQESIAKIEKHILATTKEWPTFQRVQDVPGRAGHRQDSRLDHRAGDRRPQALRQRGEFRQLLPVREEPAPEQQQEEGREQPQMRQPLSGLGLCGSGSLRLPAR